MSDAPVTLIEQHPQAVVVHVQAERLDETSLMTLRSDVATAASGSSHLPLILEMSKVNFMPSLSLGVLVQLAKEVQARKQRLILAGLQLFVRQTMAITRLDRLFEIHDDLAAAMKAAGGGV